MKETFSGLILAARHPQSRVSKEARLALAWVASTDETIRPRDLMEQRGYRAAPDKALCCFGLTHSMKEWRKECLYSCALAKNLILLRRPLRVTGADRCTADTGASDSDYPGLSPSPPNGAHLASGAKSEILTSSVAIAVRRGVLDILQVCLRRTRRPDFHLF